MFQYSLKVVLADGVKNAAASSLLYDPESSFGGVFDRWFHSTNSGHIRKVLPCKRSIPTASCNHNILRITASAFIANRIHAFCFDLCPKSRVTKAFQQI